MPGDLVARSVELRASVRRIAKIPTCVGIGPTKTIAKLANKLAKGDRTGSGVLDLSTREKRDELYPDIPISEFGAWAVPRSESFRSLASIASAGSLSSRAIRSRNTHGHRPADTRGTARGKLRAVR
jgi:DNA polymerase V